MPLPRPLPRPLQPLTRYQSLHYPLPSPPAPSYPLSPVVRAITSLPQPLDNRSPMEFLSPTSPRDRFMIQTFLLSSGASSLPQLLGDTYDVLPLLWFPPPRAALRRRKSIRGLVMFHDANASPSGSQLRLNPLETVKIYSICCHILRFASLLKGNK